MRWCRKSSADERPQADALNAYPFFPAVSFVVTAAVFTVGKSGRLTLEANAHLLDSLGFTITMIAEDKVEVEAVPEGFNTDGASLQSLIPEIIEILDNEEGGSTIRELMDQNIAQRLSCMDASRYSMPSSGLEAQRMIETLFACDNAEYTSDGRKIINIIKTEDIDKLF